MKKHSIAKAKQLGTQEFFPRAKKNADLMFNKAPLNKNEAVKEIKEKFSGQSKPARDNDFLAKVYDDEDELNDLKILGAIDETDPALVKAKQSKQEKEQIALKRQVKANRKDKEAFSNLVTKKLELDSQIERVSMAEGDVGLFCFSDKKIVCGKKDKAKMAETEHLKDG